MRASCVVWAQMYVAKGLDQERLRWRGHLIRFRPSATQWAALTLLWLGGVAATRWTFHLDFLADAIPGFSEMGIVSPVMFICAAAALCLMGNLTPLSLGSTQRAVAALALAALLTLPALMLLEHMTGLVLGVDLTRSDTHPSAANPFPGRMSPNACLGFLLSGICLLLTIARRSGMAKLVAQLLPFLVAAIGLAGCLGYFLRLEVLYALTSANRLTLPVAYGLVILAIGLWFLGDQQATPRLTFERHARQITQRSVVVITLVALAAGVGGFAAIEKSYEDNQSRTLLLTATTNAASIANALEVGLWFPKTLATRPTVTQTLQRLARHPEDADARDFLTKVGDSFLSAGITSVRFFDAAGAQVVASGDPPLEQSSASLPLSANYPRAKVLWNGGYFLHVEEPVLAGNQTLGRLVSEQRLPLLAQLLTGIRDGAPASDGLICGRAAHVALCGPSKYRPAGFSVPLRDAYGQSIFPFAGAASDHSGVMLTKDLRGVSILAAFAPVGNFGLGLVVKQDADALYAHLRERLQLLALLLVVLVVAATVTIRRLVKPLVSEIVRAEQRTHAILENSNDAFVGIDENGRITDWNGEAERTFGWTTKEARGRSVAELIIPHDKRAAHSAGLARFRTTGEGPVVNRRIEVEALHKDGSRFTAELAVASMKSDHGYVGHAFVRDITERLHAQRQLADSQKRLQAITDNLPVLISYIDQAHTVTFANKTLVDWTGVEAALAVGKPMKELLGADLYGQRVAHLNRALGGQRVEFEWTSEALSVTRNVQTVYIPDVTADGSVAGVYSLSSDVTGMKQVEKRLDHLARIDPLTGLPNRREFEERLEKAMARTRRNRRPMALVFLDVDRFKAINDSYGHAGGDTVLKEFAARLDQSTRVTDTVARLAGDEFVVILEGLEAHSQATLVCEKIGAAIRAPMRCGEHILTVTASLGFALYEGEGGTVEAFVARADRALYRAKAAGRDTFAATNFSELV